MNKSTIYILIIVSLLYFTNLITYNYTIDSLKEQFSLKLNECFTENNSLDSLEVNLISKKEGFVAEIHNKLNCFTLESINLEIEFSNEGIIDTLNLKIRDKIKPFHTGSMYVDEIKNETLRLINYSILEISDN